MIPEHRIRGLDGVMAGEVLALPDGRSAIAAALEHDAVGIAMLDAGTPEGARGTGRLPEVATGAALRGRVIDPLGRPLDGGPRVEGEPRPLFAPAPRLGERSEYRRRTLWTGVKRIDHVAPLRFGERGAIVGPSGIGKTQIALDAIAYQRGRGIACVYVVPGPPVAPVEHATVVAVPEGASAALRELAPLAGAAIAEAVRARGGDALVVYDGLAGFEPGFVARLLERADALASGGSVTAIAIVGTARGAGCATAERRLHLVRHDSPGGDGRAADPAFMSWFPSGGLFRGWGGKVLGPVIAAHFDVQNLLKAATLKLDRATRENIEHAERLLAVYAQAPGETVAPEEQAVAILAVAHRYAEYVPPAEIPGWEAGLRAFVRSRHPELLARILEKGGIERNDRELVAALEAWRSLYQQI